MAAATLCPNVEEAECPSCRSNTQSATTTPGGREQGGVRRYRVLRPTDDPNYIIVDLEFDTSDEAEAFRAALRDLWGRVGDDLGLDGPRARIVEAVESKEY